MVKNVSNRDRKSVSSTAPTQPAPSRTRLDGIVDAEALLSLISAPRALPVDLLECAGVTL